MAFNRQVEAKIISKGSAQTGDINYAKAFEKGLTLTNISQLFIDFEIERTLILSSNQANFTIYNAKPDTQQKILTPGNRIIFNAGHEDEGNIATIFFGIISTSSSYKNGTEFITKIQALDLAAVAGGLEYQFFNLSYKESTPLVQIFNDIAAQLNFSINGLANISNIILNKAYVFTGNIGSLFRSLRLIIRSYECDMYYDTGSLYLYKVGNQISNFGFVKIPSNNIIGGVENVEDAGRQDTRKRIKFNCILNPKIRPNTLVDVYGEYTKGIYTVEKVKFVGDNHASSDFKCEVEAVG